MAYQLLPNESQGFKPEVPNSASGAELQFGGWK
jgi:hypothetical protein